MDECAADTYIFVMTKMSNNYNKINNYQNLNREEENFPAQSRTKGAMILYEKCLRMNQTCEFYIVIRYYKFEYCDVTMRFNYFSPYKFVFELVKLINLTICHVISDTDILVQSVLIIFLQYFNVARW